MRTLAVIILLATATAGQTSNCSAGVSPELRKFRLGMSTAEILHQVKGIKLPAVDRQGQQEIVIRTTPNPFSERGGVVNTGSVSYVSTVAYPQFLGADVLGIALFDSAVYSITVGYDSTSKWRNLDEFIDRVSTSLSLPSSGWTEGITDDVQVLKCKGFELHAKLKGNQAFLRLFNPETPLIIAARKAEAEEKKRGSFKP